MPFFKYYYNLNFKGKGCLIFPVLARLCVLQIMNTYNNKQKKSTSRSFRSVTSDRNAYRENLACHHSDDLSFQRKMPSTFDEVLVTHVGEFGKYPNPESSSCIHSEYFHVLDIHEPSIYC